MKHRLALLLWMLPVLGFAEGTVLTLVPPSTPVAVSATVQLDLLAVNSSSSDIAFPSPDRLAGRLLADGRAWPVELAAVRPAPPTIAPGGFAFRTYAFTVPREIDGQFIVEIPQTAAGPLRAVLDVSGAKASDSASTQLSPLRGSTPAIAQVRRSFINRFAEHDPVYFIYGPDDPAAKFQFSFKYRILGFDTSDDSPSRTLQFGYTQRSLWDIDASSSPFYDTSYMPSVFYESLAPAPAAPGARFTWLGWQAGFQHESNGKDGPDSRSLNTLFARPGFALGPLDGWHLLVSPRLSAYAGGVSDNPRIKDYRGHAEWLIAFGKNDGPSLAYTGRAGRDFDHFTTQLDFTVPLRFEIADFATFLLIQYFSGYGESLLDYDQRSETVRAGISLIR